MSAETPVAMVAEGGDGPGGGPEDPSSPDPIVDASGEVTPDGSSFPSCVLSSFVFHLLFSKIKAVFFLGGGGYRRAFLRGYSSPERKRGDYAAQIWRGCPRVCFLLCVALLRLFIACVCSGSVMDPLSMVVDVTVQPALQGAESLEVSVFQDGVHGLLLVMAEVTASSQVV